MPTFQPPCPQDIFSQKSRPYEWEAQAMWKRHVQLQLSSAFIISVQASNTWIKKLPANSRSQHVNLNQLFKSPLLRTHISYWKAETSHPLSVLSKFLSHTIYDIIQCLFLISCLLFVTQQQIIRKQSWK